MFNSIVKSVFRLMALHYENQPLFNDIWDFLAGYGYSMFDIYYFQRASNGQLRYANALFVSTEVRKSIIDVS